MVGMVKKQFVVLNTWSTFSVSNEERETSGHICLFSLARGAHVKPFGCVVPLWPFPPQLEALSVLMLLV